MCHGAFIISSSVTSQKTCVFIIPAVGTSKVSAVVVQFVIWDSHSSEY